MYLNLNVVDARHEYIIAIYAWHANYMRLCECLKLQTIHLFAWQTR